MVGITYTGTDGKTTSFMSSSADDAMLRLSRIRGYGGTESDGIAAGLATGWRERHKERARKYTGGASLTGQIGGAKYSHPSGVVSGVRRVSDIDVVDGKLVKTLRSEFVSENGRVVSMGPKRTSTVFDIGNVTKSDQRTPKTSLFKEGADVSIHDGTSTISSTSEHTGTLSQERAVTRNINNSSNTISSSSSGSNGGTGSSAGGGPIGASSGGGTSGGGGEVGGN